MASEDSGAKARTRPTVSIYQNSDHVAGLVQQLYDAPLVLDETREQKTDSSGAVEFNASGTGTGSAKAKVPLVGDAKLDAGVSGSAARSKAIATGSKTTQSFVYSQAYYLKTVRNALREQDALLHLESMSAAESLRSGDFVEYQARFAASELTTFMDVLTPDLVAQIVRWGTIRDETAAFGGYDSYDAVQRASLAMHAKADAKGILAANVTRAVQADFRRDKTREYYGQIDLPTGVATAITICDNSHFVVEDEDRILDGKFTVLGKVTSEPEFDVPVLRRNKLLRHIAPTGVDAALDTLENMLASNTDPIQGLDMTAGEMLDLRIKSRVAGLSFRVIPIAIFA